MTTSNCFHDFNAKIWKWLLAHFRSNLHETQQQDDVSWETSVQFYDILTRFIMNDSETNRNENTMSKKPTEMNYVRKTEPVSVKFPFRTPLLICS